MSEKSGYEKVQPNLDRKQAGDEGLSDTMRQRLSGVEIQPESFL